MALIFETGYSNRSFGKEAKPMSKQFLFHSRIRIILTLAILMSLTGSLSDAQTHNIIPTVINDAIAGPLPADRGPIFLAQKDIGFGEASPFQENDHFVRLYIQSGLSAEPGRFSDLSETKHAIAAYGNVRQVSADGGAPAIRFDGKGDWLSIADKDAWDFGTDDFTIDLWLSFSGKTDLYDGIFSTYNRKGHDGYWLYIYNRTIHWTSLHIGLMDTGFSPAPGVWTHLAVVRHGDTVTIYVDGKARVSKNCSNIPFNSSNGVLVFGRLFTGLDGWYFRGDMDGIRVTKGLARWTNDFTPPGTHKP